MIFKSYSNKNHKNTSLSITSNDCIASPTCVGLYNARELGLPRIRRRFFRFPSLISPKEVRSCWARSSGVTEWIRALVITPFWAAVLLDPTIPSSQPNEEEVRKKK